MVYDGCWTQVLGLAGRRMESAQGRVRGSCGPGMEHSRFCRANVPGIAEADTAERVNYQVSENNKLIKNKRVMVVLPAYNAGATLERTIAEIPTEIVDESAPGR